MNDTALTHEQKKRLLTIARETLEQYVEKKDIQEFNVTDSRLKEEEGAFVSLYNGKVLRGCIGNIIGRGPLYKTVRDMTIASASEDTRFSPVMPKEINELHIEISVLSKPWVAKSIDEIILGKHGVIVSQGPFHKGVFLPQVATDTGWDKEEFLANLCSRKAGLPSDAWKDHQTKIEIFTAEVFSEKDF